VTTLPHHRLNLTASVVGTGTSGLSHDWPGRAWNRFADFRHYEHLARVARRGVLDAIFLSDHPALSRDTSRAPIHTFDPIVLFSAIAGAVPDIGFLLTASTSYNAPYNLARRIASLDSISGGRVILNLVANFNPDIAANFGSEPLLPREDRYRKADEFVQVLEELFLSWDAPVGPLPNGPLWDDTIARPIDHHGEFFDIRGPLNVPIGPQGHPVLAQAGASPAGIDFAAKRAEIVYAALLSTQGARQLRAQIDARAVVHGRSPADLRLLPGANVVLGDDEADARRRHEYLNGVGSEDELVAKFVAQQSALSPDFPAQVDPDAPLDPQWFLPREDQQLPVGFTRALHDLVAFEGLTARQVVRRTGAGGGHRLIVGSPRQVADGLLDWWAEGLVAGFNVHLPVLPDDLERFVDEVVPILQAEGAYPRSYESATIRGRFGLSTPSARTVGTEHTEAAGAA